MKEKKRLRVLTSFVGGLVKFSSKTKSMIEDMVNKDVLSKEEYIKKVNCYEILLEDIKDTFEKDSLAVSYKKFIKSNRSLFGGETSGAGNDGFNRFFLDFLDRCKKDEK